MSLTQKLDCSLSLRIQNQSDCHLPMVLSCHSKWPLSIVSPCGCVTGAQVLNCAELLLGEVPDQLLFRKPSLKCSHALLPADSRQGHKQISYGGGWGPEGEHPLQEAAEGPRGCWRHVLWGHHPGDQTQVCARLVLIELHTYTCASLFSCCS